LQKPNGSFNDEISEVEKHPIEEQVCPEEHSCDYKSQQLWISEFEHLLLNELFEV